jgi:hypothetical protein
LHFKILIGIRVEIRVWDFAGSVIIGDGVISIVGISLSGVISVVEISLSGVIGVVEISLSGVIGVVEISGSIRSGVLGSINFTLGAGGVLSFVGEGDDAVNRVDGVGFIRRRERSLRSQEAGRFLGGFLGFPRSLCDRFGSLGLRLGFGLGHSN